MWVYSDYLYVKKDFIPVFTAEEDRESPKTWKHFIPHKGMREILTGLIRALERGKPSDKRSLWVNGAYGTGKTFAAFVVKHLLEDELNEIEDYFQKHPNLDDLWRRLKALRERGNYLVVYNSSSSHITSPLKLLVELQQVIKETLKNNGYVDAPGDTLFERIIDKLTSPETIFDWRKAFAKHQDKFMDFSSPEMVIEKLKDGNLDLAGRVARVLENEGFQVNDNPRAVKNWLKQVIKQNNLEGIVFIWDEFTDFFINNVPTTSLQELAQATTEIPFYFFLVTHRSPESFQRIDEDTKKKILERFHNFKFEMGPVTAYQLVANAIEVMPDNAEKWATSKVRLWDRVAKVTTHLMDIGSEEKQDDFKGLIPIHPYAAYLLASISKQFSSSQRTLFKFLKEDDQQSFTQFLREYPNNGWYYYTADSLWDYFFLDDNSELTERVRDVVSYCRSRVDNIKQEEHKRVFKAIMLLIALWRQMTEELVKPIKSKLELIFAGTPILEKLDVITQELSEKGYIRSVPSGFSEEYMVPLMTIDERKIKEKEREIESAYPFDKIVNNNQEIGKKLLQIFELKGAAWQRQNIVIVSAKDLKNKRERVAPNIEQYQIGIVLVVAREDEDIIVAEKIADKITAATARTAYVMVQSAFGPKRWADLINHKAHHRYCQEIRDVENTKFYQKRVDNVIDEWLGNVQQGRKKVYIDGQEIEVTDQTGYESFFMQLVNKTYPYGPEQIIGKATLYTLNYGKASAEIGLGIRNKIIQPYSDLVNELKNLGFWDNEKGFVKKPDHPISRMKQSIDDFFSNTENINLYELWNLLQEPPYGLMPSPIGVTLFAFLLRDYSEGFYYKDGPDNCFPLNHQTLAGLIENVIKQKRGYDDISISKMSADDEKFCQLIREIFNLPQDKTTYPEEARKALRSFFTTLGYPIWALGYAIDYNKTLNEALEKLWGILEISDTDSNEFSNIKIKETANVLEEAREILMASVKKEKFAIGMEKFIAQKEPPLPEIMKQLEFDVPLLMNNIKQMMSEEIWLWQQEKVERQLPKIYANLYLTAALDQLCGIKTKQLQEAIDYVNNKWLAKFGKLPLSVLAETEDNQVSFIINQLNELVHQGIKIYDKKLELGKLVKESILAIRHVVQDQEGSLIRWCEKYHDFVITPEEAGEILSKLPETSYQYSLQEIKNAIESQIKRLSKSKLIQEVIVKWREITQSESPYNWSKKHKIPIQWVVEGQDFVFAFEVLNRPEGKSEEDLKKVLSFLQENVDRLKVLNDEDIVNKRFVNIAASEYQRLIKRDVDIKALKEFLYTELDIDIYYWPNSPDKVKGEAKKWVNNYYHNNAYPEVLGVIEKMPQGQIRKYLKELAADPLVGNLLLQDQD